MSVKLFVGNMSYSVTEGDLRALFNQAGQVKKITLIVDRETGEPKGFGFVEMATVADADKAIHLFNAHEIDGRPECHLAFEGRRSRFYGSAA